MDKNIKRIPIARCPVPDCGRTLMYSGDPKDKHTVMLSIANDGCNRQRKKLRREWEDRFRRS